MTGEMKCPIGYTFALRISIPLHLHVPMQHMHQHDQQWYDPLHIITWPSWFIDLDLTCSSPLCRSVGAKSCPSFTASRSIASLPRLALHLATGPSSQALSWSSPSRSHDSMSCLICNKAPPLRHHMWTNPLCIISITHY
jgi:hypothetical protein